jgi:hypothetical protein
MSRLKKASAAQFIKRNQYLPSIYFGARDANNECVKVSRYSLQPYGNGTMVLLLCCG